MLRFSVSASWALLWFATCIFGAAVHAAESPLAQQLIAEGLELRRAGQDTEALPKFEEAHRISPTPRSSAQWGLCLQAVGRWSEADSRLAEALKAKNDPWIAKNRATLKESLEAVKQNVGRVEVYGGPDGASVSINGRTVGTYPLAGAVAVNAGNVDIEVSKAGMKRGYRAVTIGGGQYQRVLIRLEEVEKTSPAIAVAPAAAAAPMPTDPGTSEPEGGLVASPEDNTGGSRPFYKKPWVWVALGVVVFGGITALALSGSGGSTGPMVDDRGTFAQ